MLSLTREELLRYCRIDEDDPLADEAEAVATSKEDYLIRQGIDVRGPDSRAALCVKAWTLHELDHPGEETPGGIRELINDLKFNR